MSPELQAAIAAAQAAEVNQKPSPAYRRGLFVLGPQFVTPSDVIAKLIDAARGKLTEEHYAPSPDAERKAHVANKARRRKYPSHGPTQFVIEVYG